MARELTDKGMSIHDMYEAALREDEKRVRPHRELLKRMVNATGCSMVTAQMWVSGFVRPGKRALQALATEFGVKWETLFPGIVELERKKEERRRNVGY
ncbi:MAG: hypothetical protein LUD72_11645 [Bacteroidales bacterium]|nr:hypothetical protein [Bacteroidales bacterium]